MLKKMRLAYLGMHLPFYMAIVFIAMIPTWLLIFAPELKKMPSNFKYSAEILSLDNFYDEKAKKFEGEHISKTLFYYKVSEIHPKYLVINNIFSVAKLSDKPIFSVSRIYYIDRYQGLHVKAENKIREGYLFAPRYVNQRPFHYWHVNYDKPALMKFQKKEMMDGLLVYLYTTHYEADQTADVNKLKDVPERKGVKANIQLKLWIEPVSGWLIQYQDNTLAYFYDCKTGKPLAPWNKFSNRYTYNSIKEQIEFAKYFKWKILFIDFIIPGILFVGALLLLLVNNLQDQHFHYRKRFVVKLKHQILLFIIYLLLISVPIIIVYYFAFHFRKTHAVKVGVSQWNDRNEFKDILRGFKDGLAKYGFIEGKNIVFIIKNPKGNIENQIDIIQSFIKDHVDLILSLSSTGTLVAKGITTELPIVFASVLYPEEIDLIASLKSSKSNLVGIRNYISLPQQFFRFEQLYPDMTSLGFIHQKGDPESELQFKELKTMLEKRKINVTAIEAIDKSDLEAKLKLLPPYSGIILSCDTLVQESDDLIISYSKKNKIPNFSCYRETVLKGGLIGYVADMYTIGRMAGRKAALILNGAEPSWLYTESPEKGMLIINEVTAKELGIEIPNELRKEADHIVRN